MALTNEQQQQDRRKAIGGSDLPKIMGDSKFTTAWELLLDKAGIEPLPFTENMYASLGNILEPIVQDKMGTTNVDEIEYSNNDFYLPILGHTDGILKEETLVEIKCVSAEIEDAYKQYRAQIQIYMHLMGLQKAELHLLQRAGKIKEAFDRVKNNYFSKKDWRLQYESEEIQHEIEEALASEFESVKIYKKDIQVKKIKYDIDYQFEIDEKLRVFCKFLQELQENPFADLDEVKTRFDLEMNGQHALVEYDTTKIEALEIQLNGFKELEKQYKAEKEKLLEFMQDNDINKIDNDKFSITRKSGYTTISIDTKKLKQEEPKLQQKLISKYEKVKNTKESLVIKLKENNNG